MKKSKVLALSVGICLSLVFLASSFLCAAPSAPIKLKVGTLYGRGLIFTEYLEWFGKELEKRTNGRVKLQWFYGGTLFKPGDGLSSLVGGVCDIAVEGSTYAAALYPLTGGTELIFTSPSDWVRFKATMEVYETYEPFRNEYEKKGVMLLGVTNSGNCIIGSKKPIAKQEDLKGLKIRALGATGSAIHKLGATPVGISYGEIYESLQRGTIDGYSTVGFGGVYGMKFHEVCPYILDPGFGNYCQVIVMIRKKMWNELPSDIREIMKELVKDWPDAQNKWQMKREKEWATKIRQEGGHLISLPASEFRRWKERVIPALWNEWLADMEKRGVKHAKELLDTYVQANKKWEPQNPYVPWHEQVK